MTQTCVTVGAEWSGSWTSARAHLERCRCARRARRAITVSTGEAPPTPVSPCKPLRRGTRNGRRFKIRDSTESLRGMPGDRGLAAGGRVECCYFAFGESEVYVIGDL